MSQADPSTARAAANSDHVIDMVHLDPQGISRLYSTLPVSKGSIRVLDLHPPARNGRLFRTTEEGIHYQRHLTGTLRVVSLADSPRFAALSYVWGGYSSPRDTIAIQSSESDRVKQDLEITASCHDALSQLRRQLGTVTIWMDSICINQTDDEEKAVQVSQMHDIFAWADPAYVWLGQGNRLSDKAMDYLSLASTYERDLYALDYLLYPNRGLYTRTVGGVRFLKRLLVGEYLYLFRGKPPFTIRMRTV